MMQIRELPGVLADAGAVLARHLPEFLPASEDEIRKARDQALELITRYRELARGAA